MKLSKANEILSLYDVQLKKEGTNWYIASVHKAEHGVTLWGYLNFKGYTKDAVLEVLNNIDELKRRGI
jgi:hypothetical protein